MTGSGKSGFTLLPDKNSLSGVDRAPEQDYNPFVVICIAGLAAHGSFIFLFFFIGANHLAILNLFSIGIWLAARRLHEGRFIWPGGGCGAPQSLTREQLDALVLGLPWQRVGEAGVISVV